MERKFASTMAQVKTSAVRDILKLTQSSDVLSFAGGLPAEESFPTEALRTAYERVLCRGAGALQYGLTEGVIPLREWIAADLARKRISTSAERLLITTGSQQAIDLIFRVMLDPGDRVLVERPTYLAAPQALGIARGVPVEVDADEEGMLLGDLEAKLSAYRPKAVYVTPTFSNPAGKLWPLERRKGLVELARRYGALIIEDDPYGDIRFDDALDVTTLYELDAASGGEGNAVYLGSFSKTVSPGLRTGFAAGPLDVIAAMAKAKQAADLHSSTIDQLALLELMTGGWDAVSHRRAISAMYRGRMERLTKLWSSGPLALLRWSEPKGGMFLWAKLPDGWNSSKLLQLAVQEGVAFVPGNPFYAGTPEENTMRINFTHTPPEPVEEATARFARAIEKYAAAKILNQ